MKIGLNIFKLGNLNKVLFCVAILPVLFIAVTGRTALASTNSAIKVYNKSTFINSIFNNGTSVVERLSSPNGKILTEIKIGEEISYNVYFEGRLLLKDSKIAITLKSGKIWGENVKLKDVINRSVKTTIEAPIYRTASIPEEYNEKYFITKSGFDFCFRVYDDGVAYRFVSKSRKEIFITNEVAEFNFVEDCTAYVPYVTRGDDGDFESQYMNSFENTYTKSSLSELNKERLIFLPLLVDCTTLKSKSKVGSGPKVCVSEVNLESYPGMFLLSDSDAKLKAHFAPYPLNQVQTGHNGIQSRPTLRGDFIAKISERNLPWRMLVIAENDVELASTNLSYLLADSCRIDDISWIKPGKVAWDWWNDWNLSGVNFKTGVNNETYKSYIDFASKYGLEYIIMDEGWSVRGPADLMQIVPEIDLKELVNYAEDKNVGIILWAGFYPFYRDMENVCKHYSELGIKGFKVDFMDRDDQWMTNFVYDAAKTCAKYKLVLDLHGMYKPAGLNRTYPNVLNVEGVHGLEQLKWHSNEVDQVKYDVQLPFIRQVSGMMDYTQGAMLNAAKDCHHASYSEPVSQGTRCHQLGLYVVFDSPLNMLSDSPSHYLNEPYFTSFLSEIPTVWDEMRVLNAEFGEYIVIAKRKGDTWYVGGINSWNERSIDLDLSFIDEKDIENLDAESIKEKEENYIIEGFYDGVNASKAASDYFVDFTSLPKSHDYTVHMASGGGFVLKISKWKPVGNRIMSEWAEKIDINNVLSEHPRPMFMRDKWLSLNGVWNYSICHGSENSSIKEVASNTTSKVTSKATAKKAFKAVSKLNMSKPDGGILVPFPIESALSGVGAKITEEDVIWYERKFEVPKEWLEDRVILNFGAVDWKADIWVNETYVGGHEGGFTPFSFDITEALNLKIDKQENQSSINKITVRVWDPTDNGPQPRGKQVSEPNSIWYTSVSGIWQTVWLESVPNLSFETLKVTPNIDNNTVNLEVSLRNNLKSEMCSTFAISEIYDIFATVFDGEEILFEKKLHDGVNVLHMPENVKLWSPDDPFLYGLELKLLPRNEGNQQNERQGDEQGGEQGDEQGGDQGERLKSYDRVKSYFAMRKFSMKKDNEGITRLQLNNKNIFQFGPLDQGWWPAGLYTAPSDEALEYDIVKTKEMGFNMIRKHIKVEPARWYSHCDRLGMIVWQDMPSGDFGPKWEPYTFMTKPVSMRTKTSENIYKKEWKEIIDNLYSYPCIAMWIPFNEAWGQFNTVEIANWTKKYDPTRLVNPASGGNFHKVGESFCGDVLDIHNYPEPAMYQYDLNKAMVLGEYGGIAYVIENHLWEPNRNWGYVEFKSSEELTNEYIKYANILKKFIKKGFTGAVYTQTTDVEVEVNGLMTYDRKIIKPNMQRIQNVNKQIIATFK